MRYIYAGISYKINAVFELLCSIIIIMSISNDDIRLPRFNALGYMAS